MVSCVGVCMRRQRQKLDEAFTIQQRRRSKTLRKTKSKPRLPFISHVRLDVVGHGRLGHPRRRVQLAVDKRRTALGQPAGAALLVRRRARRLDIRAHVKRTDAHAAVAARERGAEGVERRRCFGVFFVAFVGVCCCLFVKLN